MFTPSRLTLARERRGLTKKALAEAIGVTPHSVLRYEAGENIPGQDVLDNIVATLEFPESFFLLPDIESLPVDAVSFRSMSSMSAKERDAALAAGALACALSDWIDERFELPEPDLIDLAGDDPGIAARSLREKWALGEQPIKSMVHLLEAKGVRLFSLAENTLAVDAFSAWRQSRPFVFLNTVKSAEHGRFDAAHELGHLVLHRHGGPNGRKAEEQADQFASAFLMPAADVMATLPRVHTLNQIVEAKKRWGVSVMALIVRLARLGVITPWQYRSFAIQATERGYRKAEPFGLARERSIIWQKVLQTLWSERTTKEEIARELSIPIVELESLLFGLMGTSSEAAETFRPPLRLV